MSGPYRNSSSTNKTGFTPQSRSTSPSPGGGRHESHLCTALALLVGSAVAVDLRLLGVGWNAVPVTLPARYLLPVLHAAFAIVALIGIAMIVKNTLDVAASLASGKSA